jgi:hypothetical protein
MLSKDKVSEIAKQTFRAETIKLSRDIAELCPFCTLQTSENEIRSNFKLRVQDIFN